MHDFRGATVEDLDLPPAFVITPDTPLDHALELSFERSYSYLPVVSAKTRALLGYLSAEQLQKAARTGKVPKTAGKTTTGVADDGDTEMIDLRLATVRSFMHRFPKEEKFEKITPDTPLEELERFFDGEHDFAVVTDEDRKFVLGVAAPEDLAKFVERRPSVGLRE
ncbi:hypothetical protein BZA70DRAFT_290899 [Myxozyma melibiosi]|uniref:CBS domain-containing protein n=1 Tax=Myxozyma melibiosi TaxID=54550 RepID=A0ABR1F1W3_9ASCO